MDINTLIFICFAKFKAVHEITCVRELYLKTREELVNLLKQRKSHKDVTWHFDCHNLLFPKFRERS